MKITNSYLRALSLSLVFMLSAIAIYAQSNLSGAYVATSTTYLSGDELPDEDIIKYTYLKYTFISPDKIYVANTYYQKGTLCLFEVKGNRLVLKSEEGAVLNTMKIIEQTEDRLVLARGGTRHELDDPWTIKLTFLKEEVFQKHMAPSAKDIFSIKGTDTTFQSGQKIYAKFNGASFQNYLYNKVSDKKKGVKSGELLCTYIVDADGHADSLKITKGINPKFDLEFVKAFNSAKNMWQAAYYNNKPVKVLMKEQLKYLISEETIPAYFETQKANAAYAEQDYETALYHYDQSLALRPGDVDNLYRRGFCRKALSDLTGACADWIAIEQAGFTTADALLLKFCK